MPKFNFKLNVEKWREWQTIHSNEDHSHHSPNILVSVFAETSEEAFNTLGYVVDRDNFDLQIDSNKTTMYEIPGSCGTEHSK